jgi:hypothetical protein
VNERARFRALRFVHPDVAGEAAGGLRLSPRVGFEMVSEEDSIRQAILLLLSTVPGERVMRPTYGCLLHRVVFSPNDDTTAGLAIHYVRQALEWWEPRIEILDLDAERNPADPGRLDLTLLYRVKATLKLDQIQVPVQLSGEEVS